MSPIPVSPNHFGLSVSALLEHHFALGGHSAMNHSFLLTAGSMRPQICRPIWMNWKKEAIQVDSTVRLWFTNRSTYSAPEFGEKSEKSPHDVDMDIPLNMLESAQSSLSRQSAMANLTQTETHFYAFDDRFDMKWRAMTWDDIQLIMLCLAAASARAK